MSKIIKADKLIFHEITYPNLELAEEFSPLLDSKKEKTSPDEEQGPNNVKVTAEEIFKKAYEEGYRKGFEEGRIKGEKEGYEEGLKLGLNEADQRLKQKERELNQKLEENLIEKTKEIEVFLKKAEEELKNLILNLDEEVLTLSLKIAKKIVLKEIEVDREMLLRIIKEALNYIIEGTEIIIKVAPSEYPFLIKSIEEEKKVPLQNYKVKILSDPALSKGDLHIETKMGIVSATLEERWEKIISALGMDASKIT